MLVFSLPVLQCTPTDLVFKSKDLAIHFAGAYSCYW